MGNKTKSTPPATVKSKEAITDEVRESTFQLEESNSNEQILNSDGNEVSDKGQKKKLLSLREQMKLYETEQQNLKSKIDAMDDDIQSIKRTLNNIKITLTERGYAPDTQKAQTGAEQESEEQESVTENSAPNKNVIVSDEELSKPKKKTAVKIKQVVKKQTTTASSKKIVKSEKKAEHKSATKDLATVKKPVKTGAKESIKEKPVQSPANENIESGLKAFLSKDYQKAINDFNSTIQSTKDPEKISKCNYWLGETNFALKQWEKAIAYFQKVLKTRNAPMQDNAQMMIAESLIRSGQIPEAKKAFKVFVENYPQSEYLPRARKMLQQL